MGLTTERKVFFGLAAVAGIALVIDQGVLGPKQASAGIDIITADSLAADIVPSPINTPIQSKASSEILIERLTGQGDSAGSTPSLGAIFSFTQALADKRGADSIINELVDEMMPDIDSGEVFPIITPGATDLPVLTAVMPAKNGGGAVVSGKLLRVGDIDPNGYRLIQVKARSIIVERDSIQFTIHIPMVNDQE